MISRPLGLSTAVLTVLALPALAQPEAAAAQSPTAIVGGTVHPVSGPPITDAVLLLEGGTVAALGPAGSVEIPTGARRIDASGGIVTPGLFDAATQVGLIEVSSVGSTRDASASGDDDVRAAFRVRDGINPRSVVIPVTQAGGVTTVVTAPNGGAVSGQGAVIDLAGGSVGAMLVRDPAAMYAGFNPGAAGAAGGARGALATRLREVLDDARFYDRNRDAFSRGASRALAASRLDLEALQPVLRGEIPLVVRASRASDIEAAIRIAGEYDVRLVIEGGEEAWLVADALAAADVPVVVKPLSNLPVQFDRLGTRYDNAALLESAGVQVAISTFDTHNSRNLRQEGGNAVRHGMSMDGALRAITTVPAEIFGVSDRQGTLAPGMAANVVVWSGDPFELSTVAEHVLIRGEEVELDSRQRRLLERYRSVEGEEPVQYRRQE